MIITFPMLVSQSVSENAIPGIAKTVEGYLILNHMNDIMDDSEVRKKYRLKGFRSTRKGFFARESEDLTEAKDDIFKKGNKNEEEGKVKEIKNELDMIKNGLDSINKALEDLKKKGDEVDKKNEEDRLLKRQADLQKMEIAKNKELRDAEKAAREAEKFEREKEKEDARKATVSLKATDYRTISLEPSFIDVEVTTKHGHTEKTMIGIKVIPVRVISPEKLSRLILHDTQLKTMAASLIGFGRSILRFAYRMWDKWVARLTFRKHTEMSVSGDPRADIIMARVGGKSGLGIVVLNKNEDIDEVFLSSMPRVKRLFKLGWGNIVVADDVSRQAYFCMRSFAGVCQAISYPMMYQTLGQLKVYDSLEDAQRQNSSLFKVSKSVSKVFSEWVVENKLNKYYLSEDK